MTGDPVILKSRVLLLDRDDRALLFFTRADVATNPTRWLTPGGHLEAGETHLEAAVRELFEETGLRVAAGELGEPFWARDFLGEPSPGVIRDYHEEWYLLRVDAFEPSSAAWTPEERIDIEEWRWMGGTEMQKTAGPLEPAVLPVVLRFALGSGARPVSRG